MTAPLAVGPICQAVRPVLAAVSALTAKVEGRIYPDVRGDRPAKVVYPYVAIESRSEVPHNSMGPRDAAKWGSIAQFAVRVGSQFRSEREIQTLGSIVRAALDGLELTIAGYSEAMCEFAFLQPFDPVLAEGGITTREWVLVFEVTVHQ